MRFLKKYGWVLVLLIGIVLFFFIFFYAPSYVKNIKDGVTSINSPSSADVKPKRAVHFETQSISENFVKYNAVISADIPTLVASGVDAKTYAGNIALINTTTERLVRAEITDFKNGFTDGDGTKFDDGFGTSTFDTTFTEEERAEGTPVYSFVYYISSYEYGAAHPNSVVMGYNFDIRTGRAVTLDTLFASTTDARAESRALKALSSFCINALEDKLGKSETVTIGAAPIADNFSAFVLTDDGIRVLFSPYQVADYSAGAQEVLVPYEVLRPFANPASMDLLK